MATQGQHSKTKVFIALLIVSSLLGYLEWGTDQHSFLFQVELEVLSKLRSDPGGILHPFVIIPLLGQLLLLIALLKTNPKAWLIYAGIGCLSLLLGLLLFIGIIGSNLKIAGATLPFFILAFLTIRHLRAIRKAS